jgi:ethanolamine utilization microcompartment shell protein EutS
MEREHRCSTKNAIRDKFESLSGADGDGIYDESGTVPSSTAVTVTDNLNFDANTLYIDATSNEIGIGTATPSQALDVAGNIALNGSIDVGSNVVVAGLVDGRDVADDGASLDELYDGEGGISTATVATNDKVLIHDAGSGDVLRTVTAQSIANLAGGADGDGIFTSGNDGSTVSTNFNVELTDKMIFNQSISNGIVIDGANARLGVMTASPTEALHVTGAAIITSRTGTATNLGGWDAGNKAVNVTVGGGLGFNFRNFAD